MQFTNILTIFSLTMTGALAAPGACSVPTPTPTNCCPPPPPATSSAAASIINQVNICQSGSPYCCALAATNGDGHSCNSMDGSTINCDSTVVCCNDNGNGTQICTNSLTVVIPIDLNSIL
ncbi:hypothetical protein BDZ45DRAFT_753987 [Acephala macrosclerotiorum]|nr:hypothetical protein BDZ45DRAFT_753987 [Acephala macrosclerotiorum]